MNSFTRYIIVDPERDVYALVSKEVVGGQLVVRFQIDTNIKIIKTDTDELCDIIYESIDKTFATHYYEAPNAANEFSPKDFLGTQIISYHLN